MDINGSVAMVTGGASGLGLATVEALVAKGARAVIVDLPGSAGHDVAATMAEAVRFAPADVRDPDQMSAALEVAATMGDLRTVVNCAGVGDPARVISHS